jgi:Fusaric acid resistance protein family
MATTYHLHRLARSVRVWCAAIAVQMPRPWWPTEAVSAARLALTSVGAIYLAMLLELDRPEWAGWTVLSVSLATRASSLQKSLWRAISSIIGCGIAVALTANFAQSTLAFDAAIALWLALLTAAASVERGQRSYGFALMGYTVPIVTLANVDQPGLVFHVAVDRCSTLLLGIACAHASSVLVAPGVREVSSSLADRLDAAATACGEWLRAVERGDNVPEPPVFQILALDPAVADAFTEQPSLQTGRRAVSDAPISLLQLLAIGLLQRRLGLRDGSEASALLGNHFAGWGRQLPRLQSASRQLREGRRTGNRHTPVRRLSTTRYEPPWRSPWPMASGMCPAGRRGQAR